MKRQNVFTIKLTRRAAFVTASEAVPVFRVRAGDADRQTERHDLGIRAKQAVLKFAAAVPRMNAMPTDDDCFGPGRAREDGRKTHPAYLFEAKKTPESKHARDFLS